MLIIIARVLYVIKSSCTVCRSKLAETLMSRGYKSSEADADVWMKQEFKPNGYPYYNYMLCYYYDLLHIGFKSKEYMDALNMIYRLKEVSVPTDRYLVANVE